MESKDKGKKERDASSRVVGECTLLSKYKVKWERIYVGIKVQLFGTICIT